jgi:hypothetical protein
MRQVFCKIPSRAPDKMLLLLLLLLYEIEQVGSHKRAPPVPDSLPGSLQQLMQQCLAVAPAQRPTARQALQVNKGTAVVRTGRPILLMHASLESCG